MSTSKSYRVSVQRRNLITLPKEVRKELKISEGDVLDLRISENKIIMEPYKLVPSSQAYFWNKKTREDILEAREDVKAGRVREVSSVEEFLEALEDD